jgi:SAM-dependent methyltransferase
MRTTAPDLDALEFSSYTGFNARLVRWRYEEIAEHLIGRTCLELGSSDGQGTELLLERFDTVTAVDGSAVALQGLRDRLGAEPALRIVESYFEELELGERYDTVIAGHILEHVDDPAAVLAVARAHLADGGVLVADVPNALSLHRRIGVKLGLLGAETDLNETDRAIGHQRVYTPDGFRAEVERAGFRIVYSGGVFLRLLSNAQTEALFDERLHAACLEVGRDLPDLACEIYVVAHAT